MSSSAPRSDLRLLSGDAEGRWRLTVTGAGLDARLSAVYRTSCGGRFELVFSRMFLDEAPRRLRLQSTSRTVLEARSDDVIAVEEAVRAGRDLMARAMTGTLETLAPDAPCEGAGRLRRRVTSAAR